MEQDSSESKTPTATTQPNTLQPPPSLMQGPPPGMAPFGNPNQFNGPPFGMPPPGFPPTWGGPGAPPPGWPAGMPPPGGPWGIPPLMGQMGQIDESIILAQVDPEIIAKASDWSEHKAPDGRFYYYNSKKGESVWEKPPALKDLESKNRNHTLRFKVDLFNHYNFILAAKLAAAQGISSRVQEESKESGVGSSAESGGKSDSSAKGNDINKELKDAQAQAHESAEKERKRREEEESAKKKKEEEDKQKEQKVQDKSRPISSTPVPGTPW